MSLRASHIPRAMTDLIASTAKISAGINLALSRMDDMRAGYPSTASGADAGSGGSRVMMVGADPVPVTATEARALGGQVDRAARDHATTLRLLARALDDLGEVTRIVQRYAAGHVDPKQLSNATNDHCPNCLEHGHVVMRAKGRRHCTWCDEYRQAEKALPDGPLVRKHAAGKRLNESDIASHRRRRKAAKKGKAA